MADRSTGTRGIVRNDKSGLYRARMVRRGNRLDTGYVETFNEALEALEAFCEDHGYPRPASRRVR